MKKTLFALALAATGAFAASSSFAQDMGGPNGGWFVNGNAGRASLNSGPYDGHDTAYAIGGGYRWAFSPQVAIGAEVGYNDLGNIHLKNVFNNNNVVDQGRSQLHGWTAGANGHFNLTPNWYVSARTGVYSWDGHGLSNNVNPVRKSLSDTSWYAGAGVGYDFSNNASVGINYDHYDASKSQVDLSTNVISVSAEYRF